MGAIVDETQLGRVLGYIEAGKSEGAGSHLGGAASARKRRLLRRADDLRRGLERHDDRREEIFGPVLSRCRSPSSTRRSRSRTTRSTACRPGSGRTTSTSRTGGARDQGGIVWVNTFDAGDISSPFGGFKQSGFGRDKSIHALDKFTDLKAIWIALRD
jgi:gamma-glutamyl-gamma-aminobutyraldehyde dehydrogenase/4-guanidinobutyraldehyde dehydrogenase/NAD-dependent aldehyde dehydrogenase